MARESFAEMAREVIDLIPQKVRGDARIDVAIPPDLAWPVNKNELEQAMLVLINNAIDAMGQKGRVEITATETPEEITVAFRDGSTLVPIQLAFGSEFRLLSTPQLSFFVEGGLNLHEAFGYVAGAIAWRFDEVKLRTR